MFLCHKLSAHSTILSLATETLSSVVSDENDFLAYLILKIVVSDKNLLYVFPSHSKFSSPVTKIFVLSDENRAVCARLYYLTDGHLTKLCKLYGLCAVSKIFL